MKEIIVDILTALRNDYDGDYPKLLERTIHLYNSRVPRGGKHAAKKLLIPYYLNLKRTNPIEWAALGITPDLERKLIGVLQVKPRRSASGVATVTVITKPWKCSGECIYCPNDLTMPKSYLPDEPACQRALRNFFDPFLQVVTRVRALSQMGHVTDKVELIVLGGTWNDYPEAYRIWFTKELFRALNTFSTCEPEEETLRGHYRHLGLPITPDAARAIAADEQQSVNEGDKTYSQAWGALYGESSAWKSLERVETATFEELEEQQRLNERAQHRVVGLVFETRPDAITAENLTVLRRLGCTKVQMGIQSVNDDKLEANHRNLDTQGIARAFELTRLFGFKIHAHFMVNLLGANPDEDRNDYATFIGDPAYSPDEVKLYPCALIDGTELCRRYATGEWKPYDEDTLIDLLVDDTLLTPPYVRISRMIRDFSAHDIVAGNKKVNLRQLVENRIEERGGRVVEMRYREIGTRALSDRSVDMVDLPYTTSVSQEHCLQWVTRDGSLAGFLRLTLPDRDVVAAHGDSLPLHPDEAMIREVHVYGTAAAIHTAGVSAQHQGLGRALIERACTIAREAGYTSIGVISSVGTREYYRNQGFEDDGLYQVRRLEDNKGRA